MPTMLEEKLDLVDAAEVHWGTNTILAVFFAASLISAVFFGLGYSFGRGGTPKLTSGAAITESAGPPAGSASTQMPRPRDSQFDTQRGAAASALPSDRGSDHARPLHVADPEASAIQSRRATTASPAAAAAHYMVQVGAIGNRKDARTLVLQLRKRGFHAGIYSGKRDEFLHVQIGPFATAEQAETMRHRVIASGHHAILKHAS